MRRKFSRRKFLAAAGVALPALLMGHAAWVEPKLYVNPGIGWFTLPLRFNCRPELTVFEI